MDITAQQLSKKICRMTGIYEASKKRGFTDCSTEMFYVDYIEPGQPKKAPFVLRTDDQLSMFLPWSQRFSLIFLCERDQELAAKRRQRVAKATRRERKTSGYLGLESHFHADDSCQTRQIANKKSDQWPFSKHVLISCYFFKRG